MKRTISFGSVAAALYAFAAWHVSGARGVACALVVLCVVAAARCNEKSIERNAAFWFDMLYAAILAIPFALVVLGK